MLASLTQQLRRQTHHLRRLRTANRELEIGVFLPVSEEEREFSEEAVIDVAHELDGRRTGVSSYAALELGGARNESFPSLKLIFVLYL
jgi:hypothetical protein